MANLVSSVAFVALLAGLAAGAPFSHRSHLNQKLTCVTCHASATRSTAVEDNNLPNAAICAGCHTGATGAAPKLPADFAIKQASPAKIAKFSHAQHLKLGNIAPVLLGGINAKTYLSPPGNLAQQLNTKNQCEACHRGLHESDAVTDAAFPRMADCLVCHKTIDPPFSCWTCHSEKAKLTPASHDAKWLDFHSSGKANLDKESCAVCHGRKFTCRGCHVG